MQKKIHKRIAYHKGLEKYANSLEEYGFELFPYADGIPFDALIFNESKSTGLLNSLKGVQKELFLLNVNHLSVEESADILKKRLYSSMF